LTRQPAPTRGGTIGEIPPAISRVVGDAGGRRVHQAAQLLGKNDPSGELLGGAGVQDLPHLPGQGRRREGLLQEFGLGFERTPVDDRVGGIP
jgi:hypothetical protein